MKFHIFVELILLSVLTIFLTFCFAQFGLASSERLKLEAKMKILQELVFENADSAKRVVSVEGKMSSIYSNSSCRLFKEVPANTRQYLRANKELTIKGFDELQKIELDQEIQMECVYHGKNGKGASVFESSKISIDIIEESLPVKITNPNMSEVEL